MTYKIISERVGKPGDKYEPEDGVNVAALVEHGFISDDKSKKSKPESE